MVGKDSLCRLPEWRTDLRRRVKRATYLRHLLETFHEEGDPLHDAPIWEEWLARSGELPPDFDALPTNAFLPSLLAFDDGTPVRTPGDWQRRRQEVLATLEHYQLGTCPPPPPSMLVEELGEEPDGATNCTLRRIRLVYGPSAQAVAAEAGVAWRDYSMYRVAQLGAEVLLPPGNGPFPAMVGLGYRRGGRLADRLAPFAARRGYVVCLFDMIDAFGARDVYAGYDCTELGWWAYAASRCLDYLQGLGCVDAARVAVAGHSRGGKMAAVAAALDGRFAAAIASHPGAGAGSVAPWRYLGEKYGGETLEYSTRCYPYWNHPRLRFFAGRENKLPFDSHFLLALIAPRPLLIGEGEADDVDECWGGQQAYLATREVYELLGAPQGASIAFHPGAHELGDGALEEYVDWLDMSFGRRPFLPRAELMYTYTFDRWRQVTGEAIDPAAFPERGLGDLLVAEDGAAVRTREAWAAKREAIKGRVLWALGELPEVRPPAGPALSEVRSTPLGLLKADLPIDGQLVAHLTYPGSLPAQSLPPGSAGGLPPGSAGGLSPRSAGGLPARALPAVIFLHSYQDSRGHAWSAEYGWTPSVGERLAQCGYLAVEYDQFGYGARNRDCGLEFYAAHPRQSALGVMVQDLRRVIDALAGLEIVDARRIMVAGFSLGGAVGLHAAALDERIRAVASTCGFASLRRDAHGSQTEGLRRYSHLRPTLPRLGFFVGQEARVPYDYHELLALIAPRPAFILAPRLDQDWVFADVRACCDAAREVYRFLGAEGNLRVEAPDDFNRYPPRYQERVNAWLLDVAAVGESDG